MRQEMAKTELSRKIAKILGEVQTSNAAQHRKIKELKLLRSKSPSVSQFLAVFTQTLLPLFLVQKRLAPAERIVRFVSSYSSSRDLEDASNSDEFVENFLRFLLNFVTAASKSARFRACQLIAEIILLLPDDSEVSDELWDEVIEAMKVRVVDKVPLVRTFAVRALSRFVSDADNSDILDFFLEMLPLEQNPEVRKTIVLSLPPLTATSQVIIDCTMDVNESVRRAAYFVIANKFPLQSLSIKHRTMILQRGLADRSPAVSKDCLKLLTDQWLPSSCNGNPIELLKYLDVETYESVGESVMSVLLKAGLVKLKEGESIRKYILSDHDENQGALDNGTPSIKLIEPEVALYWRTVCKNLQMEAQAKGSDAAATMGAEAAVYAADASDDNDLLERVLPASVSDYIELVKAHIDAGPNYHFASRQLLLLGEMLDFSDAAIQKVASSFVRDLLRRPIEHEDDNEGNKIVIGDGINLGGDRYWADAVARLARKVHAAPGELEGVLLGVVEELAQPCRERTADFLQWMHSLAVTGLLLENAKSFYSVQGRAIDPIELLHSLLLPAAKHVHPDVQRIAARCLGIFGLLENKPSEELVKQLRLSVVKGSPPVRIFACKALFDLGMWHGPPEIDRAMGENLSSQLQEDQLHFSPINFSDTDEDFSVSLLDLLYSGLETINRGMPLENSDSESVQAVLGEGFAKLLLLSDKYQSIPAPLSPLLLAKLVNLYFSNESKDLQRLKQCLSVFFEHYASLSANHKKYLSKAFIPAMRLMWPGIFGNAGGSSFVVSNMRKRAVQASKFMVQMMQAPLYAKETAKEGTEFGNEESPENLDGSPQPAVECGEEGLAIRIASEVLSFRAKKTAAEKAYVSALCKVLVSLHFRLSEQSAIKLTRKLLNCLCESVLAEKDLIKELKQMAEHLKGLDQHPDQDLSVDEEKIIFETLDLEPNLELNVPAAIPQTPVQRSTRPTQPRRRAKREEVSSDEEDSPGSTRSLNPIVPSSIGPRSQRTSKTAALNKITATKASRIDEDSEEDNSSNVTSDDSDDYDQLSE